jgi:polysaccharide biosynthesis/export protein
MIFSTTSTSSFVDLSEHRRDTPNAERRRSMVVHAILVFLLSAPMTFAQQQNRYDQDRSDRTPSIVANTTSMEVLNDHRPLRVGDRLSMRIVEDPKSLTSLFIGDSGEVEVPLIGRLVAKGQTCKQLAYSIKGPMERDYYYKATVIVGLDQATLKSPGRLYITGQVRTQGAIEIPADETFTVSKAILRAGGFADFANRKRVKLVRKLANGSTETKILDLDLVTVKGKTELDVPVEPDDTIIVPERLVNF